jgi:hypothetical protein
VISKYSSDSSNSGFPLSSSSSCPGVSSAVAAQQGKIQAMMLGRKISTKLLIVMSMMINVNTCACVCVSARVCVCIFRMKMDQCVCVCVCVIVCLYVPHTHKYEREHTHTHTHKNTHTHTHTCTQKHSEGYTLGETPCKHRVEGLVGA